jgi:hypothetical protein
MIWLASLGNGAPENIDDDWRMMPRVARLPTSTVQTSGALARRLQA